MIYTIYKCQHYANTCFYYAQHMGVPPCLVHLISMCWHSVGMAQLGHLLVGPSEASAILVGTGRDTEDASL